MAEKIKYWFEEGAKEFPLKKSSDGASGIDAVSQDSLRIGPGETVLVHTGLHVKIPKGYEIQVRPRSGLALKNGITVLNTPGTIDSDYLGEIGVILFNSSKTAYYVTHGDRIAQLVVNRIYTRDSFFEQVETFEELGETDRGQGGFGSTGKK